jgi:hypothetical protein
MVWLDLVELLDQDLDARLLQLPTHSCGQYMFKVIVVYVLRIGAFTTMKKDNCFRNSSTEWHISSCHDSFQWISKVVAKFQCFLSTKQSKSESLESQDISKRMMVKYSQTYIKESPLGYKRKSVLMGQLTSEKRFNSYEIFYDRTRKRCFYVGFWSVHYKLCT